MKLHSILTFSLLFIFIIFIAPIKVVGATTSLSVEKIYQHVESIAQKPHPTGSIENQKVREYIIKELKSNHITPIIQEEEIVTTNKGRSTFIISTTVHNIIAKVKGTDGGKSLVIMAHYDSVPFGPGANDDGVAVANMLEMAKKMNDTDVKNDVIFLFTDAEELGMLGAKAFWEKHPLARDVGLVINLEARGSKGPLTMFQTSSDNGWLIDEFGKSAPNPVASSLTGDFYQLMPNDSDLTIALNKGVSGLNFAYGGGWTDYHTEMDSLDTLDKSTVQHVSKTIYQLVNHFSQQDLTSIKQPDKIYFTIFGKLIHYSKSLMYILSIVTLLVFLFSLVRALKTKYINGRRLLFSIGGILAAIALIGGINSLLWVVIINTWAKDVKVWTTMYQANLILFAILLLNLSLVFLLFKLLLKKVTNHELYVGGLLWWSVLLGCSIFYLPGATYLFMWPLLIMTVPLLFLIKNKKYLLSSTIFTLFIIALLFISFFKMLFTWMPIAMVAPILSLVVLLFISLILVYQPGRFIYGSTLSVAIILFIASGIMSTPSKERPMDSNLFYTLNANTNQAHWISKTDLNSWTEQFFPKASKDNLDIFIPNRGFISDVLVNEAPALSYPSPNVQIIKDVKEGDTRRFSMKVAQHIEARTFMLEFSEGEVIEAFLNGKLIEPLPGDESLGNWRLTYYGIPKSGVNLEVVLKNSNNVKIRVSDWYDTLPNIVKNDFLPKPDSITSRLEYSDSTIITKEIDL